MPNFGSTPGLISQNISQTVDNQGNPIISSDTGFGSSPLGYAARVQALFGLPNGTFELTPPDTTISIDKANPLPYWDVQDYSAGVMTATAVYDATTNNWGVKLNPGTATTNDYITLTTRSYLVNDDNLSLRQKALAIVSKNGTYAGATQWNLQLTATYYDATDTVLHSGTVATIYDNATWTSMSGTTTTSGTAINASARYVDLQFKLTATAAVTSATSVTLKSCLLQTSTGAAAASTFLITQTFTAGTTWTVPTGVTQIQALVAVGGGGGGGGGALLVVPVSGVAGGGGGGGGGQGLWVTNLDLGTATSITVGIGAGGSGGTAGSGNWTEPKAGGGTLVINGGNGAAGGASTFGTFITALGGGGGSGGTAANGSAACGSADPGTAAGSASIYYPVSLSPGRAGGTAAGNTNNSFTTGIGGAVAGSAGLSGYAAFSLVGTAVFPTVAGSGLAGTVSGSTPAYSRYSGGGTGGTVGFSGGGGGGGGGGGQQNGITQRANGGANGGAGGGGGGGGGAFVGLLGNTGTATFTGGNGGTAGSFSAGGGGGGGGLAVVEDNSSTPYSGTARAGAGGPGASGFIVVAYIG